MVEFKITPRLRTASDGLIMVKHTLRDGSYIIEFDL